LKHEKKERRRKGPEDCAKSSFPLRRGTGRERKMQSPTYFNGRIEKGGKGGEVNAKRFVITTCFFTEGRGEIGERGGKKGLRVGKGGEEGEDKKEGASRFLLP